MQNATGRRGRSHDAEVWTFHGSELTTRSVGDPCVPCRRVLCALRASSMASPPFGRPAWSCAFPGRCGSPPGDPSGRVPATSSGDGGRDRLPTGRRWNTCALPYGNTSTTSTDVPFGLTFVRYSGAAPAKGPRWRIQGSRPVGCALERKRRPRTLREHVRSEGAHTAHRGTLHRVKDAHSTPTAWMQ